MIEKDDIINNKVKKSTAIFIDGSWLYFAAKRKSFFA